MVAVYSRFGLCVVVLLMATMLVSAHRPRAGGDDIQVAIKGYDPVAYFTLGKAVKGRMEISYDWDERRYHFLTAGHRDLFKAEPSRYAPQFANHCAMSLTRGELVEGNPEYWLVRDNKLYIFGKPIGPDLYQQAFKESIAKAESNRPLIGKK